MSRTAYYTATTLDGFIADPEDSLAWLFKQGQSEDPDEPLGYETFIQRVGALVMGSTTYAWICDHLGESGEVGATWPYSVPTWVATHRTFATPEGADVRFVEGDVAPVHAAMLQAAGDKDVWVVGGGDLAGQFADAGLMDEVIVQIAPVTLGAGRPLLPRRLDLRLVETMRNADFVACRYDVVGSLAV